MASAGFFHPGERRDSPTRNAKLHGHVHVADPPPFGVGSKRFSKKDTVLPGQYAPAYHAAYRDMNQPSRWSTKGWSNIDDAIKAGRGTSTGKVFSSMAPKSAPPPYGSTLQPLYATYPNETRLQELLDLQRRRQGQAPAPNAYNLQDMPMPKHTTFRRPAHPELDGPFFLNPDDPNAMSQSTRVQEIAKVIRNPADSGIGPGEYEGLMQKDATSALRAPVAASIGTGDRSGKTSHAKSLSISRSIQHGIDWHVPVIVQPRAAGSTGAGSSGAASRATTTPAPAEGAAGAQHQQHEGHSPLYDSCMAAGGGASAQARYMDTSPPRAPTAGRPPAPPPPVARTVRKPLTQSPGDWDWSKLGHNYRNNWTTLHGGPYSHGDRAHMRRTNSAPNDTLSSFGPDSSIDISTLPVTSTAIFPIPEESSSMFKDIGNGTGAVPSPTRAGGSPPWGRTNALTPLGFFGGSSASPSVFSAPNSVPTTTGGGGSVPTSPVLYPRTTPGTGYTEHGLQQHSSVSPRSAAGQAESLGAATTALRTPKDIARHSQAVQAASIAQQSSARRSEWLTKSSHDPSAGPLMLPPGSAGGQVVAAVS